jgi:hypothetical protein
MGPAVEGVIGSGIGGRVALSAGGGMAEAGAVKGEGEGERRRAKARTTNMDGGVDDLGVDVDGIGRKDGGDAEAARFAASGEDGIERDGDARAAGGELDAEDVLKKHVLAFLRDDAEVAISDAEDGGFEGGLATGAGRSRWAGGGGAICAVKSGRPRRTGGAILAGVSYETFGAFYSDAGGAYWAGWAGCSELAFCPRRPRMSTWSGRPWE